MSNPAKSKSHQGDSTPEELGAPIRVGEPLLESRDAKILPMRVEQAQPDALDHFKPESASSKTAKSATPKWSPMLGIVALLVALAGVAFFYIRFAAPARGAAAAAAARGHVTLNSRPSGAEVSVDGHALGSTPLELDLTAGAHELVFRRDGGERRLALQVEAGVRASENVDIPAAAPATGQLEVTSEPSGARVTIDGSAAGTTPLAPRSVSAARHVITIGQGDTTVSRMVDVAAGATSNVFVTLAKEGRGAGGFVAFDSPVEFRVMENGQLVGLSSAASLMLPAGRHQFELVNDTIDMRVTKTVTVETGRSSRVSIALPNGTLSVNARPWAEVFLDGRSLGPTPIGNVAVQVGSHELVWRHPQLGEKRQTVIVGAQAPTRVSMDLSR